jgi:hypothetical protein
MRHLGDYDLSTVIYGKFTTYQPSTGAAFTLGGTPALSVYKDNSTTQSTTGVTLTASFDSVTGLNHFAIDTSADGTFYSAGSFFDVVITTGTVDSVSVVGSVVASFTIRKDSSLKPTTAARTLDVSAGGEAGLDWANVGSPTTALALTGTTIATTQKVDVETIKTNPVVNAGTVTFPTTATLASTTNITGGTITTATNVTTVNGLAANVITAASMAADAVAEIADAVWDEARAGHVAAGSFGEGAASVQGNVTGSVGSVTGAVGSVTGAVGSVTGAVGSVTGNVGGNVTGSVGSVTGLTNATIADAVWDEAQAGHVTAGSFGEVATEVAAILVDTAEIGAAGAGLTALATQASVNTIDGIVDSILVDTAEIGAAGAGLTNINLPNQTMDIVGNITGNLSGSVGSVAANGLSASSLAADAVAEIADGVWDEALAGHAGAGSAGEALSAAGTAGDPWTTSLPGAYGAGTAGFILGTNLDVAASTLATAANLATAAGYIDTEVAAIKAKTDNLPASPAAVGSAMTLTSAYDFAKGDVAVAEAYATDGAEFTPAQALYMIWGLLAEKNIAGTTMTIKKLDGSTSAMTFTLNDATTPTAITRAT